MDFWTWFLNKAKDLEIETEDLAEFITEIADYGALQRSVGIALGRTAAKDSMTDPF
jgi:hypothetical protein